MNKTAMDAALAVRLQSDMKTKVGACIVKGGRIIGIGCNKTGSKNGSGWSRHAEIRALLRSATPVGGGDIYVGRVHGYTLELLTAKPCRECAAGLSAANVRRVYYTTPDGWKEMKL